MDWSSSWCNASSSREDTRPSLCSDRLRRRERVIMRFGLDPLMLDCDGGGDGEELSAPPSWLGIATSPSSVLFPTFSGEADTIVPGMG